MQLTKLSKDIIPGYNTDWAALIAPKVLNSTKPISLATIWFGVWVFYFNQF